MINAEETDAAIMLRDIRLFLLALDALGGRKNQLFQRPAASDRESKSYCQAE